MPCLEYNVDGILSSSELNTQQRNEFFETMKDSVWKIALRTESLEQMTYNGVCIRKGKHKIIVTSRLGRGYESGSVRVHSSSGKSYIPEFVDEVERVGLSLIYVEFDEKPKYVKTISSSVDIGTRLYGILYGVGETYPMFSMVKCVIPYHSDPSHSYLNIKPNMHGEVWLDDDVSLIQVELENANTEFGSGFGSPVFNSKGHLLRIVGFHVECWDMVIPSSYIGSLPERKKKTKKNTKTK